MSNWIHTKLEPNIDILTGFPFKSDFYVEDNDSESMRLLRGDNIIQGSIRWENVKRYPVHLIENLDQYYLQVNDLVIAMDRTWVSSGLKISTIQRDGIPSLLVQRVARLRAKQGIIQEYLPYILRSHNFEQYVKGVQTETAVPHISAKQIRDFPVLLPPIEEQRVIASILLMWDKAIALTENLIAAKRRLKQGLMQQVFFSKKCNSWKSYIFGDVFERVTRKNDVGCELVVTSSGEQGLINQQEFFNRRVASADLSGYYLIKRGEFAYNRSSMKGYPYGALKRLDRYEAAALSTLYVCFRLMNEEFNSDFFLYLFESGVLNGEIYGIVHEGARSHGLLNLSIQTFFDIKIHVPEIEFQNKVAAFFGNVDRELNLLIQYLEYLQKQKRGLMQKLLTGEIRIPIPNDVA